MGYLYSSVIVVAVVGGDDGVDNENDGPRLLGGPVYVCRHQDLQTQAASSTGGSLVVIAFVVVAAGFDGEDDGSRPSDGALSIFRHQHLQVPAVTSRSGLSVYVRWWW